MGIEWQVPDVLAEPLCADEVRLVSLPRTPADGRAALLTVLGRTLRREPDQVQLESGRRGKPFLGDVERHGLHFNWSHSGGRALIAMALDCELGVDLERRRERSRALALAQRYFTPAEHRQLQQARDDQRSMLFLRLWTAKEALLKALGRGIAFGLDRVDIRIEEDGLMRIIRFDGEVPQRWHLHAANPDSGHLASVAWRGAARRIRAVTLREPLQ